MEISLQSGLESLLRDNVTAFGDQSRFSVDDCVTATFSAFPAEWACHLESMREKGAKILEDARTESAASTTAPSSTPPSTT